MAFPTTAVLDNFNTGASQSLLARTGWANTQLGAANPFTTDATPTRAGNSGLGGNWWPLVATNYEVFLTIPVWVPSTATIHLAARITVASAVPTYYALILSEVNPTDFQIYKVVGGTRTALGTNLPTTVVSGDGIGLSVIGTQVTSYWKSGAGAWTQQQTLSDSSIAGPGIGIGMTMQFSGAVFIDDFGGGSLDAALPFAPLPADTRGSRSWDRSRYQGVPSKTVQVFFPNPVVPGMLVAVAQSRQVPNYRGSYSLFAGAADEKIDSYSPGQVLERPVENYTPPPSRMVPSFTPTVAPGTDFAVVVQGFRPDYRYDGGRSQSVVVWDPATSTFADWNPSPVVSRPAPFYSPPRSLVPPVAWGTSVITDAFVAAVLSRVTPFYNAPRSAFSAVFDQPAVISSTDWASVAQGYRPPFRYMGGPSRAFPVWDPATNTYADWVAQPTMSRPVPLYRAPASQIAQAWASPVTVVGTEWVPAIVSRSVPFYRGSYSLFAGAADEGIDSWAAVAQSRPVPFYRPPPSVVLPSLGVTTPAAPDAYSPGVTRSLMHDYYQASQSFASLGWDDHACTTLFPDTMLGPDTLLFPDLCPQVELAFVVQNRVVPFYRGSASVVIPVYDTTAQAFVAWTPGVIQGRVGAAARAVRSLVPFPWQIPDGYAPVAQSGRAPAKPPVPSQVIMPGQTPVAPDTYVPIAQSPVRAPQRGPGSSTSIGLPAAAPADGYVPVATSRPDMGAVVRQSATILPDLGLVVVTLPPQGGGGEWVIWGKPSFPGNAPGAWPRFPAPYFRRPSRREKRGY